MSADEENNDRLDKALFLFNAATIPALAILFSLEAFGIGAHSINASIAHIFIGTLAMYVTMKRAGRWGKESKTKRKGEWIALGFLAYVMLVLAPLYVVFPSVVWPSLLTPITFEIMGLLAGNEVVKAIEKQRRNKG